jgi:hypothetical protein
MIKFARQTPKAIEAQRAKIRAANARIVELEAEWAIALERRNEACYSPKGIQRERYRVWKNRQRELEERAIPRAKADAKLARDILILMLPEPHAPRRIKSTPTKCVRGPNGTAIPRGN